MSLDRLCFILVERQKANAIRRRYLGRLRSAEKKQSKLKRRADDQYKDPRMAKIISDLKENHTNYRRVADLMNAQRPLLRELRKATGARMKYNSNNMCLNVVVDGKTLSWKQISNLHNTYVFESTVIKEVSTDNPYAKELYGKEVRQEEAE